MPKRKGKRPRTTTRYTDACDLLENALTGTTRQEILDAALEFRTVGEALGPLRTAMRSHTFRTASGGLFLKRLVETLDKQTRASGFHVLRDWDGKANRFSREIIPVDMLDYFGRMAGGDRPDREPLAILLDYYFLYVLSLVVMRAWDEGDANENLDRVSRLLDALQGPSGSGIRFVDDPETLLWVAISHYQPDERAYPRLLENVRTLDEGRQLSFALISASILGCHLRWGFEAIYKRDHTLLRRDNSGDYPWVLFSLATLMRAYARMNDAGIEGVEREDVVGALLNGLTSDAPAFTGEPPESLADYREEHASFSELYDRYEDDLLEEFQRHCPSEESYSPLAFHFNFPHNVVKAMVGTALAREATPNLPLNALVTREPAGGSGESRLILAHKLMDFGRSNPERFGSRRVMIIVYRLRIGLSSFKRTVLERV